MAFITIDDLKSQARITSAFTDAELQVAVDAACAVVVDACGPIEPTTYTETVTPAGGVFVVSHSPIVSITSATDGAGVAVSTAGWRLEGSEGLVRAPVGGSFPSSLTVTYSAGFTAPPPWASLAARIIAAHMWKTRLGPSRDNPDGGAGFLVPRQAEVLMAPHRLIGGFA